MQQIQYLWCNIRLSLKDTQLCAACTIACVDALTELLRWDLHVSRPAPEKVTGLMTSLVSQSPLSLLTGLSGR